MERIFFLVLGVTDLSVVLKLFTSTQGEDYSLGIHANGGNELAMGIFITLSSVSLVYYNWALFIVMDSRLYRDCISPNTPHV